MAKKKLTEDAPESELEREVDQMMDPRAPDPQPASELVAADADEGTEDNDEKLLVIDDKTSEPVNDNSSIPADETDNLNDDKTAAAVDEINRNDSDELLAAEDGVASKAGKSLAKKPRSHKKFWRFVLPLFVLVCIAAALAVPTSRYWIFNQVGLRGTVGLMVIDKATGQPLESASVAIEGRHGTTDAKGRVSLENVKLGRQVLIIKAPAFATVRENLTITLGQNKLGNVSLEPVGISYKFKLTDYLSGQPVVGAEVTSDASGVPSDTNGTAVLALDNSGNDTTTTKKIKLTASGYNTKVISLPAIPSDKIINVNLVPSGKDYFVSNNEIFSVNLDGGSRKAVLAGVKNPDALVANDSGGLLALVSADTDSRQSLVIINTKTARSQQIDSAKSIKLVGWLDGSTLVYVADQTCDGGSPCQQLVSYDYETGASKELASSGSFSSVLAIAGSIYYVTGTDYQSSAKPEFATVNSDGTNEKVLLQQNIYGVYRIDYGKLDLAAAGQWYGYDASSGELQKIDAPTSPDNNFYVDSPSAKLAAWIDNGKIMIYTEASQASKNLANISNASYPIRWLGDATLIYRSGSADYAVSLAGGQPHKVTNVVNVGGASAF